VTIKEAARLQTGAIVRESWSTQPSAVRGIVLKKRYEDLTKLEPELCQKKNNRYMVTVAWFKIRPNSYNGRQLVTETSSYGLMLVSNPK
jgi:hypothetical protein|tara:strand:+ start:1834 stop:2100 length:267 start_codon:yes stop_codon:yes gene_type:complete